MRNLILKVIAFDVAIAASVLVVTYMHTPPAVDMPTSISSSHSFVMNADKSIIECLGGC